LQRAGSQRIEHAPRDVDVRDRVTIEKKIAVLKVVQKRK
jgi:hypothetical protein